jgi:heat shock protein HslJ
MRTLSRSVAFTVACATLALAGCQSASPPAQELADTDSAPASLDEPAAGDPTAGDPAADELSLPFRARGQEPGWFMTAESGTVTLVTGFGERSVTLPLKSIEQQGSIARLHAADAGHRLTAEVERSVCSDTMSDIPFPYRVTVALDGEQLSGCGGESVDLLTGATWVVEDLDGGGIVDRSHISLEFLVELGQRRVAGLASCNRYFADFELTGESLTFGRPGSTMMACAPSLMAQEQKFLRILQGVRSFDIDPTGALILRGPEGTMLARRETAPDR